MKGPCRAVSSVTMFGSFLTVSVCCDLFILLECLEASGLIIYITIQNVFGWGDS